MFFLTLHLFLCVNTFIRMTLVLSLIHLSVIADPLKDQYDPDDPATHEGVLQLPDDVISAPLNRACSLFGDIVPEITGDTLSYHWAQQLIGADLLKEELKKTPLPNQHNWISVFDNTQHTQGPLDEDIPMHADKVAGLISGENAHTVLPKLGKHQIQKFHTELTQDYISTSLHIEDRKTFPSFINNSMDWPDDALYIYETFQLFANKGSVIVTSAGNDTLKLLSVRKDIQDKGLGALHNHKTEASKNFDIIIVGSFSPSGFVSDSSQEGEELHILAPSDNYLSFINENEEYSKFSATSGAAPLVTGSLAAFEWLSGYHPTAKEAKFLLEKTSTPIIHSHEQPRKNGVGLLNTYKLGMVGKRLKEKCKDRETICFQNEIKNVENYRFPVQQTLYADILMSFQECASGISARRIISTAKSTCEGKEITLRKLRKAVLLNPTNRRLWKVLSCIYEDSGLSRNAEAINSIAVSTGLKEEVVNYLQSAFNNNYSISVGLFRAIHNISGPQVSDQVLQAFFQQSDIVTKIHLVTMASHAEQSMATKIINTALEYEKDLSVLTEVAKTVSLRGDENTERILYDLFAFTRPKRHSINEEISEENKYAIREIAKAAGVTGTISVIDAILSTYGNPKHINYSPDIRNYTSQVIANELTDYYIHQGTEDNQLMVAKATAEMGGSRGENILHQLVSRPITKAVAFQIIESSKILKVPMVPIELFRKHQYLTDGDSRDIKIRIIEAAMETRDTTALFILGNINDPDNPEIQSLIDSAIIEVERVQKEFLHKEKDND